MRSAPEGAKDIPRVLNECYNGSSKSSFQYPLRHLFAVVLIFVTNTVVIRFIKQRFVTVKLLRKGLLIAREQVSLVLIHQISEFLLHFIAQPLTYDQFFQGK